MIQQPPESTEVAESTEPDCLLYPVPYTVYHALLYRITNATGNRGNPPVRPSLFWEEPASSLHARSQGFHLFLSAWTGPHQHGS